MKTIHKIKLGDIIQLHYGKSLTEDVRSFGNFPVYGSSGIVDYHNKFLVSGPGIIIGRKGNVGSVFFEKNDFFPIDTVYFVKRKNEDDDIKYLYYLLKYLPLNKLNSDAAVPGLNRENALKVKTFLHNQSTQQKIASILSAYDELINLNRRRIQLLEESARLLFREWFVYFRFPGSEKVRIIDGVPEGWSKEKLVKIGYLNYGKSLVNEMREDGEFKVYGSSGIVGVHSKYLVEGPGIVVGRKGNVGAIYWIDDNFWPIDTVFYISKEQSNLFLYFSLKSIGFINTDASVPGLNREYAHGKTILIPTENLLRDFLNQANQLQNMVKNLTTQKQKLAQARDLLLPRLMSGEIEPKEIAV